MISQPKRDLVSGDTDRLSTALSARQEEIEGTILVRVYGVSDQNQDGDPDYLDGLRSAVRAAVEYGFEVVGRRAQSSPPIPIALLSQARRAARGGIGLDTVLRRYFAGYNLLTDFLVEEVEDGGYLSGPELQRLRRSLATHFDRVSAAVSEEHRRECAHGHETRDERRAALVRRALQGEWLDSAELDYVLDGQHIGVVGIGDGASQAIREIATLTGDRVLLIRHDEETVWAWLGRQDGPRHDLFDRLGSMSIPARVSLAFGEPGLSVRGWRLSHRQARAAAAVAKRDGSPMVRYAEVALLASMLQDDLLSESLRTLYLAPLARGRDGGKVTRETLRAYFAAEQNASSSAAALGVSRRTVANRLKAIEGRFERSLSEIGLELQAALHLFDLENIPSR